MGADPVGGERAGAKTLPAGPPSSPRRLLRTGEHIDHYWTRLLSVRLHDMPLDIVQAIEYRALFAQWFEEPSIFGVLRLDTTVEIPPLNQMVRRRSGPAALIPVGRPATETVHPAGSGRDRRGRLRHFTRPRRTSRSIGSESLWCERDVSHPPETRRTHHEVWHLVASYEPRDGAPWVGLHH